jgi:hypothetical protein
MTARPFSSGAARATDDRLAVAASENGLHVVAVQRPEDLGQRIRFQVGVPVS